MRHIESFPHSDLVTQTETGRHGLASYGFRLAGIPEAGVQDLTLTSLKFFNSSKVLLAINI